MNWSLPQSVTDVDLAFGGQIEKLLPVESEIPEEFWNEESKWWRLASDIFYNRELSCEIHEKEGIDPVLAVRHLRAIYVSYQIRFEHKIAGCAFLLNQFFEDIE